MLLKTWVQKYIFKSLLSILSVTYLDMELLDDILFDFLRNHHIIYEISPIHQQCTSLLIFFICLSTHSFLFSSHWHYKFCPPQKIQLLFLWLGMNYNTKTKPLAMIWKFCQWCMIQFAITLYDLRLLSGKGLSMVRKV